MKITRSFSRKIQLKQYEPIDVFCAVEIEVGDKDMQEVSTYADNFCRAEVKKTIESVLKNQEKITNKKNRKVEVSEDAKNTAEIDVLSDIDVE